MLRLATITLLTLLLSACGFALRGTAELPAVLQPLYVEGAENATPLVRELLRVMSNNRIEIAAAGSADGYSLALAGATATERALSVNANARAGEYEITLSVAYQLRHGADAVMEPQLLSLSKVYLADPENAIAQTEEAELIRTEMRRELAQLILRRLQAYQP